MGLSRRCDGPDADRRHPISAVRVTTLAPGHETVGAILPKLHSAIG
jgi:hypothetical protein